jgi:hypothetical protein
MARGSSRHTRRVGREDAAAAAAAAVRRRAVASGVIVLVASVVVLFCCARGDRPPRTPSLTSSSARSASPLQPLPQPTTSAAPASTSATPVQPDAGPLAPAASAGRPADRRATMLGVAGAAAGSASGGGARIANVVATTDPRDLRLLSRIERELGQTPSPAVHAILRRRRDGAQRSELLALARALPELPLRVLVIRWIDEVSPP